MLHSKIPFNLRAWIRFYSIWGLKISLFVHFLYQLPLEYLLLAKSFRHLLHFSQLTRVLFADNIWLRLTTICPRKILRSLLNFPFPIFPTECLVPCLPQISFAFAFNLEAAAVVLQLFDSIFQLLGSFILNK